MSTKPIQVLWGGEWITVTNWRPHKHRALTILAEVIDRRNRTVMAPFTRRNYRHTAPTP